MRGLIPRVGAICEEDMVSSTNSICAKTRNRAKSMIYETGTPHAVHSISAAGWSGARPSKDYPMSIRFETAQRIAFSLVGALFFAAVAVGTAVPIIPIA